MIMTNNVEVLTVHYKTPDLIYRQYNSVRKIYPTIPYRIIDGSDDGQFYFEDLEKEDKNIKVERLGYNIHHGPGMHYGITTSFYDFLLIMDSDVYIKKEIINDMYNHYKGYAVGKELMVDKKGLEKDQHKKYWWKSFNKIKYPYIHPSCILINKNAYLQFKQFKKHGAPCIDAMIDIFNKNKTDILSSFNLEGYIELEEKGTRKRWGINLK